VMLKESLKAHRNPGRCHRVGSVHGLHMKVGLGGVARVAARCEVLPTSDNLTLINTDRTALQMHHRNKAAVVRKLQHHIISRKPHGALSEPVRLTEHVGDECKL